MKQRTGTWNYKGVLRTCKLRTIDLEQGSDGVWRNTPVMKEPEIAETPIHAFVCFGLFVFACWATSHVLTWLHM